MEDPMPRPEKKVHIPLGFKEALSDLLKVNPDDEPQDQGDEDQDDSASEEE